MKIRELRKGQNKMRAEKGRDEAKDRPAKKKLRTIEPKKQKGPKDIREFYNNVCNEDHPKEENLTEQDEHTVEENLRKNHREQSVCKDGEDEGEQDENTINETADETLTDENEHTVLEEKITKPRGLTKEIGLLTTQDDHCVNEG